MKNQTSSRRNYTPLDQLLMGVDVGIRTLFGQPKITERSNPAHSQSHAELNDSERQLAGRLMRINHAGEVAAQGLYQGQALTARLPKVRQQMERAALEENDHLDWCEKRAKELGTRNPTYFDIDGSAHGAWGITGHPTVFVVDRAGVVVREIDRIAMLNGDDQGDAGEGMLRLLESELAAELDDLLR